LRFLADENFPRAAVAALQAAGHDIAWVRLAAPGAADADVLAVAASESRVLLTFDNDFGDRDFGELAARWALPPGCGIVLFRVPAPSSDRAGQRLAARIAVRDDWNGHFSVVEPGRVRMRRLR
jgi:predicted nuclease of predicted toxin-antitoxin system